MSKLYPYSVSLAHNTIEQLRVDVDDMGHVELIDAMILPPLTKVDTTARVSMAGDAQPRTDDERAKLATESSDIDAMIMELQAAVDKVEEILVTHWLEVFEAFGWIGCANADDDDDGILDEELDLSDVPEAER